MKNVTTLSVIAAVLFFPAAVSARETLFETVHAAQEHNVTLKILVGSGEKFNISSDKIITLNNDNVFVGNVIVTFQSATLKAESVTVIKQADGTSLLEVTNVSHP